MKREQAIEIILNRIHKNDVVIATTGKTGRELFELREKRGESHAQDFLNIGAMGHASMIALGIALAKPKSAVWCLDGDGALLMHMGALAIIGAAQSQNVRHVVLNNGAHDSVGGQPTAGFFVDMSAIARACGYRIAARVAEEKELERALEKCLPAVGKAGARVKGPVLIEVLIKSGSRSDLGRPTMSPENMKKVFMKMLQ